MAPVLGHTGLGGRASSLPKFVIVMVTLGDFLVGYIYATNGRVTDRFEADIGLVGAA